MLYSLSFKSFPCAVHGRYLKESINFLAAEFSCLDELEDNSSYRKIPDCVFAGNGQFQTRLCWRKVFSCGVSGAQHTFAHSDGVQRLLGLPSRAVLLFGSHLVYPLAPGLLDQALRTIFFIPPL